MFVYFFSEERASRSKALPMQLNQRYRYRYLKYISGNLLTEIGTAVILVFLSEHFVQILSRFRRREGRA